MNKTQPAHITSLCTVLVVVLCAHSFAQTSTKTEERTNLFPSNLVSFEPFAQNPVFAGEGQGAWDHAIRERGFILRDDDGYHLWYTGYAGGRSDTKYLGYATSPDGIQWTRHPDNPIFAESWVEDVCVVKHNNTYYMFAEGRGDIAHLLCSKDRRTWIDMGRLDVRQTDGEQIPAGPYGTPTVWIENGVWYLFYERRDAGVWLATSKDRRIWTNVQDDPVLQKGPGKYDMYAVAMNQVIKHNGRYYAYYHGSGHLPWRDWNTNVATSTDLVHWTKYDKNPIVSGNKSSGIVVHDGLAYRLYTMHPDVRLYLHRTTK
jgi:hypothetical protein